jgi:hypothetical protein
MENAAMRSSRVCLLTLAFGPVLLFACSSVPAAPSPDLTPAADSASPDGGPTPPDGSTDGSPGPDQPGVATASIVGDVFAFLTEVAGPRVSGATISVLEQPDISTTTDAQGHFQIDGLAVGSEVTLVLDHPMFYPTQSATYTLGPRGIDPFTIQALPKTLFAAISSLFTGVDQTMHCALATTVTRLGGTLHVSVRQGEPGALLQLSPAAAGAQGPIYFSEAVLPDQSLTQTTKDGGGLYYNVPPGDYQLTATKSGVTFTPVKMKCRPGFVVDAGPPIAVQASVANPDWGPPAMMVNDAYTASTDALCEMTGACVTAAHGAAAYPAETVASCQAHFRRALGFVDPTCDAMAGLRDAWKGFFDCRAASCDLTLGDDTACPTEEQAYVDALAAYAPCYTAAHAP